MRRHDSDLSSDAELVAMSYKAGPHTVGPIRMDPGTRGVVGDTGGVKRPIRIRRFLRRGDAAGLDSCLEIGNQDFAHSGFPAAG